MSIFDIIQPVSIEGLILSSTWYAIFTLFLYFTSFIIPPIYGYGFPNHNGKFFYLILRKKKGLQFIWSLAVLFGLNNLFYS